MARFSTDNYISTILKAAGLHQGGGKRDHYMAEAHIQPDDEGRLEITAGSLHFRAETVAVTARLALSAAGVQTTQYGTCLVYDQRAATAVARSKWLGQRQGFAAWTRSARAGSTAGPGATSPACTA